MVLDRKATAFPGKMAKESAALDVPLIPVQRGEMKQPHMFFGLCDTRRAIVILNITTMILVIPAILYWAKLSEVAKSEMTNTTIELTPDQVSMVLKTYPYMLGAYSLVIVASFGALVGASQFITNYVQVAAFIYVLQMGLSIWQYGLLRQWIGLGVDVATTLLWIYPHAMFMKEIEEGVLTKASYEPQSICCKSSSAAKADQVQDAFSIKKEDV